MKKTVKERIIEAASELFQKKGYNNVSIDEIIEKAGTSKGGFYYYFDSKDQLLSGWIPQIDQVYKEWFENADASKSYKELLQEFNHLVLRKIEMGMPPEMVSVIYSTQLSMMPEKKINDTDRALFRSLHELIKGGQKNGEFKQDHSFREYTRMLITIQRGIIYEWCINDGMYGLEQVGGDILDMFVDAMCV